jgi:hypothetical protein
MIRFALASLLCLAASLAQAAGFQRIEVTANGALPPLKGAIWYPCAKPPGEVKIGPNVLTVAEDCPIAGGKLPLVVISHQGRRLPGSPRHGRGAGRRRFRLRRDQSSRRYG